MGPFVIVAPHAVDADDKNTGDIAKELANDLSGYFLINSKFHKACGKEGCKRDEDFNHLPPSDSSGYDWSKRAPEMKHFYEELQSMAKAAGKKQSGNNKRPLVVFLHGMKHDKYDIDLGAGMRTAPNMTINAAQHRESKDNTGGITAPVSFVENLKKALESSGLAVGSGDMFSAWDSQNGAQYLKSVGIDCYCIQIEINSNLRRNPKKIAMILSAAIKSMSDFSEPLY